MKRRVFICLLNFTFVVIILSRAIADDGSPSASINTDGLNQARSVGIADWQIRMSGIHWQGSSLVADFLRKGASLHLLRESVTTSTAPHISNLDTEVFANDIATCGSEYPDRVSLKFDYYDSNADVLAGRVGVSTAAMLRSGCGPVTGGFTGTFFPQPKQGLILDPPTGTSGVVMMDTCWGNVSHIDISVQLKDGDDNLSPEKLTTSVDIPESTSQKDVANLSSAGGGMKLSEW